MNEHEWRPTPPNRVLHLLVFFLVAFLLLGLVNMIIPTSFTHNLKGTFEQALGLVIEYAICYSVVALIYAKWMRRAKDPDLRGH